MRLLTFVQTLTNMFDVSPSGTHVAIIAYSTDSKLVLSFNTLSGSSLNAAEVSRRIGAVSWQRGVTRIDKALLMANSQVFTQAAGMRNVKKVSGFKRVGMTPCTCVGMQPIWRTEQ